MTPDEISRREQQLVSEARRVMAEAFGVNSELSSLASIPESATLSTLERKRMLLHSVRRVRDYAELLLRAGSLYRRAADLVEPSLEEQVHALERDTHDP